ncbi:MAG: phenylacetate--CoA ligase family protein [Caldilineae bacterium]|nr:MAG: phenylacetate--CoA ligase family protein [Caldilineae bacterium]
MTTPLDDRNARLQEQIRHAYANAPAVRRRFQEAGLSPDDVQTIDDLAKIPVMPKDAVVALQQADPPFGGLLAAPMDQVRHIFFSPGPIYEPDTGDDESLNRMAQEALRRSGFRAGDIVLNTLSYHLVPAGLMLDKALTGMGCVVVPGGVGNSDLQLKMMVDLQVTGYVGTPSFLLALLEKADAAGMAVDSLGKALCTAEPLFPHQREKLTARGLTVGNAYATAELGFLALNTDGSREMQLLPDPIIQVVDPETGAEVAPGSPGEVVVTNFSRAYPLIRLGTGDMAILLDPAPGQSRQEERAIILVGRSGEAKKVRGMFVHPNQLRFAVGQVLPGAAVQGAVLHDEAGKDFFVVRVVGQEDEGQAAAIAEAVRQVCRVRVNRVEWVDALPEGAPGMVDERDWG